MNDNDEDEDVADKLDGKTAEKKSKTGPGPSARREKLNRAKERRFKTVTNKRDDGRNYSLEGMRLATVLHQLQALQAIQGLSEIAPKKKRDRERFEFSENPAERAAQYQWLMFKADWLEALLEDTIDQLDALAALERKRTGKDESGAVDALQDGKSGTKPNANGKDTGRRKIEHNDETHTTTR